LRVPDENYSRNVSCALLLISTFSFPDFEQRTRVKSFIGSITDTHVVNRACEGVNVVMHIASVIDWRMFPNYKALHEVNVTGMYY